MRGRGIGFVLLAVGCGPDLAPQAFAERCGEVGPIQLLALAPDETAQSDWPHDSAPFVTAVQVGDRWLVGVRLFETPIGPDTWVSGEDPPALVSSRVVSVDECGGDPRVVARGAHLIRPPRGAEPWIACSDDHRIVVFDPALEGAGVAHPDLLCTDDVLDGDFVTSTLVESHAARVVRATLGADGTRQTFDLAPAGAPREYLRTDDTRGQVFLIDEAQSLVAVDARDGTSQVLRESVSNFYISDDGRFIEWSPDALYAEGTWYLWDRTTDEQRALTIDGQTTVKSFGFDDGVLSYFIDVGPWEYAQHLLWLDRGETQTLDGLWDVHGRFGDMSLLSTAGAVGVLDHASGALRIVSNQSINPAWAADDAVRGTALVGDPLGNRRRMIEFAAPEFEPRVVVEDVYYPVRLADGRWLTVRGTDRATPVFHGTLVALDESGAATEIDHDVAATLHEYNGGNRRNGPPPELSNSVVYAVRDDDQERTGVWLATFAD
jgi:hypothetical protein